MNEVKKPEKSSRENNEKGSSLVQSVKFITSLPPEHRSHQELEKLYSKLNFIKFFKSLEQENSKETVLSCCKFITYEYFPPGSFVINQGEKGIKFYVILEGRADVIRENEEGEHQFLVELKTGDSFGERALMLGLPRAASVKTNTDSHMLVLDIINYKRILNEFISEKFNTLVKVLRMLPFLKNQSENLLQRLVFYFKCRNYKRGQKVFSEGNPAEFVYVVKSGEFKITKKVQFSVTKKMNALRETSLDQKKYLVDTQLASLRRGEMIGEEDVIKGSNCSCSCVCSEEGALLVISKEHFLKQVVRNKESLDTLESRVQVKLEQRKVLIEAAQKIRSSSLKPNSYSLPDSSKNSKKSLEQPKELPKTQSKLYLGKKPSYSVFEKFPKNLSLKGVSQRLSESNVPPISTLNRKLTRTPQQIASSSRIPKKTPTSEKKLPVNFHTFMMKMNKRNKTKVSITNLLSSKQVISPREPREVKLKPVFSQPTRKVVNVSEINFD